MSIEPTGNKSRMRLPSPFLSIIVGGPGTDTDDSFALCVGPPNQRGDHCASVYSRSDRSAIAEFCRCRMFRLILVVPKRGTRALASGAGTTYGDGDASGGADSGGDGDGEGGNNGHEASKCSNTTRTRLRIMRMELGHQCMPISLGCFGGGCGGSDGGNHCGLGDSRSTWSISNLA